MALVEIVAKLLAAPIKRSIKNGYEEAQDIHAMVENLPAIEKQEYDKQFQERKKSILLGYAFWSFGIHYLYTQQWFKFVFFIGTLGGLFVWWMLDGILMYHIVGQYNRKISKDILFNLPLSQSTVMKTGINGSSAAQGMIGAAQARLSKQRRDAPPENIASLQ